SQYPENRRLRYADVVFVTVNVPGSNNGYAPDGAGPEPSTHRTSEDRRRANEEYALRDTANRAWLRSSFDLARRTLAAGVMIVIQADTVPELRDHAERARRGLDGFDAFLRELTGESRAFGRPVVLVNGDSHFFKIDRPLYDEVGRPVRNFVRVQ